MNRSENVSDSGGNQETAHRFDDVYYRALAARSRRRVLAHLLECNTTRTAELADVLCGWETSSSGVADSETHERFRVELRHSHLPSLDDAGLVDYDRENERVTLRELDSRVVAEIRRSVTADQ